MAAAFDTRFAKPGGSRGSAAKGIAGRLEQRGYRLIAPPESFFVTGEHELEGGETEHATAWAPTSRTARPRAPLASLVLLVPVVTLRVSVGTQAPPVLLAEAAIVALVALVYRRGQLARAWSSVPVVWLGRAALAAAAATSSVELARDVNAIF